MQKMCCGAGRGQPKAAPTSEGWVIVGHSQDIADGGGPVRLGMLTPSSNTVLEPVTSRLLGGTPGVSVHATRLRVTRIGLSETALAQFGTARMLDGAGLLADARVHSILWNGTSAAWLGFESDERFCRAVTDRTGNPASTSVLAFRDLFAGQGWRRIGLVTPYTGDVQARIQANWGAAGFDCRAGRHLGLSENYAFAEVPGEEIARMVREVAREGVDAVAIVCTNLAGALLAPDLERETGVPVCDSVAVTLWQALRLAGRSPATLSRWGRLFALDAGRHGSCLPLRPNGDRS